MLLDEEGRLAGLFTDSDLARLIEARREDALDQPVIAEVMTRRPRCRCAVGSRVGRGAGAVASSTRSASCPSSTPTAAPSGLLDITDLMGLESLAAEPARAPAPKRVGRAFPA